MESIQSETFRSLVKPMETVHRVIWLVYIATVPIYVCLAYVFFARTAPGATRPEGISFTIPVVILALLTAVLAPYVPRQLLSDSRLRQVLNRPTDPKATISPDEQRLLALVPMFFVGFIIRLAFNEAVALYGLVLAFGSHSFVVILPFAIASLALNLMVPFPLDSALARAASLGLQPGGISPPP